MIWVRECPAVQAGTSNPFLLYDKRSMKCEMNYLRARDEPAREQECPSDGRSERTRGGSCFSFKSALLSGSNQVLPDCILNKFCIGSNVKHFHDSILVKRDGAGGNV